MQMVAYMRLVDINKTSVINLITAIIIILPSSSYARAGGGVVYERGWAR